ncbi:MAG: hypothetical protein HOF02_06395 [Gammaproteobacteria bacterium]|nr:hypothetical protein [Gammaproteobacteria bacterium]
MTLPFMSYVQRTGLDLDDAEKLDDITLTAQTAKPWIKLQTSFRARGLKKVAKAEAAAIIVTETFKLSKGLEKEQELLLLRAAVSIFAYQYQENLTDKFETYKISTDLIDQHRDLLNAQYETSKDLSQNKGFFEKLLG